MQTVKQPDRTIEPLLTIGDVSQALNVSRATVYRLMETGELEPVRIRSRTRFAPSDVQAFIERQRETSDVLESAEPAVAGSKARRNLNRGREYHRSPTPG
jgi:excisionase family DNA binding protein